MAVDYKKLATQEYDTSYNQKVQALKNELQSKVGNLDSSKVGINKNFDRNIANQNRQTTSAKNNFSNQVLSRGLGRSSIATSGLGELDVINNRKIGDINDNRTDALNQIDMQKSNLRNSLEKTLGVMSADRLDAIAKLSRQLEDRAFEKQMKEQANAREQARLKLSQDQFEWQKAQAEKARRIASSYGGSYRGSSRGSSGGSSRSSWGSSDIAQYNGVYATVKGLKDNLSGLQALRKEFVIKGFGKSKSDALKVIDNHIRKLKASNAQKSYVSNAYAQYAKDRKKETYSGANRNRYKAYQTLKKDSDSNSKYKNYLKSKEKYYYNRY